ncbi:MAG: DUF309 domain-containing protein [Candidatus Binatia bacterium]
MKIATRNALANLCLAAFNQPVAAAALNCLARYCRAPKERLGAVSAAQFLASVPGDQHDGVKTLLRGNPLVSWTTRAGLDSVEATPILLTEYEEITTQLRRSTAALAEWLPDSAESELLTALRKGCLLFNYQLFFAVHEVLEEQWKEEQSDARLFLQGLIQVAVAFHHLGNGNFRGTIALLYEGSEKLAPYQPRFLGVEVQRFLIQLERCRQELLRLGSERLAQFPWGMVPHLARE